VGLNNYNKKKMKMKKLYLDDVRIPRHSYPAMSRRIGSDAAIYQNDDWSIVRTYDEFVNWIGENGLPDIVSFDHDLADEHIQYYFDNGGKDNPPDPQKTTFEEKTGYDCAKWLVDYCVKTQQKLPEYLVHSANPVGGYNILTYLNNAKKHTNI
jgi:hypothetical protein